MPSMVWSSSARLAATVGWGVVLTLRGSGYDTARSPARWWRGTIADRYVQSQEPVGQKDTGQADAPQQADRQVYRASSYKQKEKIGIAVARDFDSARRRMLCPDR